ncbi:MAG TPA: MBL fold metallo-hydrolase [Gaiellaceae bacterium]|nr:MBL fold metallo-hydrolase [Gaiellaceae bacterium]
MVLFRQFVDEDLGCGSYLVGDEHAGLAAIVDPGYAIERYVDACEEAGVRPVVVLETHTHADHVSGHGRLALEHGVPVRVHEAAEATFPHEPLRDGDEIELGDVVLRVVHTPGHRPEHCAIEVLDRGTTVALLTGDSLFVGDAARPDLAVDAAEGAEDLFRSLHRLLGLGDAVDVYPGHVAGSLCGANLSPERSTTIGREREQNAALVATHEEFMCRSTGPQPPRPPNMESIVELNRGPFVGAQPPLAHVDEAPGAVVLDVRSADAFAAGHRRGAVNVPVDGSSFGTKAAFVLPPARPILLEAEDAEQAGRAAERLYAVALFDVAGRREPGADETLEAVTVDELERLLAAGEVQVFDVRESSERDEGFIPGSVHLPYRNVRAAAENGLCDEKPIVTICESGARAAVAASVLRSVGVDARPVLAGGVATWPGATYSFRRCGGS